MIPRLSYHRDVSAAPLAHRLQRATPSQIGEALRSPDEGGVPLETGFYAWWIKPGVLPGLPEMLHPAEPWALLYVGIAPRAATSSATLRSRILNNHVRGNIASSTFRFALASMLFESRGWQPIRSGSKLKLAEMTIARFASGNSNIFV
jgi:hypothetical protein